MVGLEKPNYRIYALILGEVLKTGNLFDCEIVKITFKDQKDKKFSPIQSIFSSKGAAEIEYNSYASTLRYIDPIKIKSEYVIVYDIYEKDIEGALGGAIRYFDKICRFLTIAYAEDFKKYTKRNSIVIPYLFQVNKINGLVETGETELQYKIESGNFYLPNRPELSEWRDRGTEQFLKNIFNFHDDILERAIKYLYRSSIGSFVKDSPEKISLDHFKSMEIIIKDLVKKGKFKERVRKAAKIINLTIEQENRIKELWDERSKYSDTAHPSEFDQTERYPNQFPLPSNVTYPHSMYDSLAVDVCLKYYKYKKNLFYIDIDDLYSGAKEEFGEVNVHCESNHLYFLTSEKNTENLKKKIIENFSRLYKFQNTNVIHVVIKPGRKSAILKI